MSHCLSQDSLRPKLVLQHHHALAMLNTPALTITASASVQSGPRSPRRTPSTARPARPSRRPSTSSAAEHIDERLHGVVVPTGRRRRRRPLFLRRDVRGGLHLGGLPAELERPLHLLVVRLLGHRPQRGRGRRHERHLPGVRITPLVASSHSLLHLYL